MKNSSSTVESLGLRLSFACVALLAFTSLAGAQTHSRNSGSRSTHDEGTARKRSVSVSKPTAPPYIDKPFDPAASSLPPNYNGVDPELLVQAINASPSLAPKSEFETTTKYQDRVASFEASPLVPGLRPTDPIALVLIQEETVVKASNEITTSMTSSLGVTYDADSSQFLLTVKAEQKRLFLEPERPEMSLVQLARTIYDRKKYMASNAMGAEVEVTEVDSNGYGVAIDPNSWIFSRSGSWPHHFFEPPTIKLRVPPEMAASVKPQLAVALVGILVKPWQQKDVFGHDPTFDDPVKILEGLHYAVLEPSQLIVFRRDTGEILKRVDSNVMENDQNLALNLRTSCKTDRNYYEVSVDGRRDDVRCSQMPMLRANREIRIEFMSGSGDLTDLSFTLNGRPYSPNVTPHSCCLIVTAP